MGKIHNFFLKSHLVARHACSVPSDVVGGGQQLRIFFFFLQSSTDFAKSLQFFFFFFFFGVSGNRLTLTVRPSFIVILSLHPLFWFLSSSFYTAGK